MGSYLREVHTVGIHLRHWERLAGGQFGCVQWLGFHEVEFIMSVRRRSNSQLPAWSLKSLPISIFSRRLGEPCLYPVNVTRIQASRLRDSLLLTFRKAGFGDLTVWVRFSARRAGQRTRILCRLL
jgi:hypothetical protein